MTEDTIQRVFTSQDWNDSECDVCCKYTGVVLLGDQRVCYDDLLNNFDESGEPFDQSAAFAEIAEDAAKRIALHNLAYNLVFLAFGVLIGSLVTAGAAQEVFGK